MIFSRVRELFQDQIHIVLVFGVIIGIMAAIFVPILLSADLFSNGSCSVDSRPTPPTLLSVTQDPQTLTVTAELRDESDNEQWFTLERTLFTRRNQTVVVGTDTPRPDSTKLPFSEEVGRTVMIDDRGIVENRKPVPGIEYVYTVRAFNCYDRSEPSNDITILSLYPPEE